MERLVACFVLLAGGCTTADDRVHVFVGTQGEWPTVTIDFEDPDGTQVPFTRTPCNVRDCTQDDEYVATVKDGGSFGLDRSYCASPTACSSQGFGIRGLRPGDRIVLFGAHHALPDSCTCDSPTLVSDPAGGTGWDIPAGRFQIARHIFSSEDPSATPPQSSSSDDTIDGDATQHVPETDCPDCIPARHLGIAIVTCSDPDVDYDAVRAYAYESC